MGLFGTKIKNGKIVGEGRERNQQNHTSLGIFKYIGSKLVSEKIVPKKFFLNKIPKNCGGNFLSRKRNFFKKQTSSFVSSKQREREKDEAIIFSRIVCLRQLHALRQSSIEDEMTGQYKSRYPVQHFGVPVDAH